MSIEDRALERLNDPWDEDGRDGPLPMTDEEHRATFGWAWDDPDGGDDLPIIWGPPEAV